MCPHYPSEGSLYPTTYAHSNDARYFESARRAQRASAEATQACPRTHRNIWIKFFLFIVQTGLVHTEEATAASTDNELGINGGFHASGGATTNNCICFTAISSPKLSINSVGILIVGSADSSLK